MIPEKQEILFFFGSTLFVIGVLGFVHSPVLGLFPMTMWKALLYMFAAMGFYALALQNDATIKRYSRTLAYCFGVLGIVGPFVNPLLTVFFPFTAADVSLHIFLVSVLLYLGFTDADHSISLLKSA